MSFFAVKCSRINLQWEDCRILHLLAQMHDCVMTERTSAKRGLQDRQSLGMGLEPSTDNIIIAKGGCRLVSFWHLPWPRGQAGTDNIPEQISLNLPCSWFGWMRENADYKTTHLYRYTVIFQRSQEIKNNKKGWRLQGAFIVKYMTYCVCQRIKLWFHFCSHTGSFCKVKYKESCFHPRRTRKTSIILAA